MKSFWLCFVPLFVAFNAIGVLPVFVNLTEGVLTTSLLLVNVHNTIITSLAIAANILIVGGILFMAPLINRVLGKTGSKALAKIISLLLAAIGVMIVRRGIAMFIAGGIQV